MSDKMEGLHTSAIDLISSIHGHQRRVERAIDKRDLQAAIKHGKKELNIRHKPDGTLSYRWKYTFADVVYITDSSSTFEITSWVVPLPLETVSFSDHDEHQYKAAKNRISNNSKLPKMCTWHDNIFYSIHSKCFYFSF